MPRTKEELQLVLAGCLAVLRQKVKFKFEMMKARRGMGGVLQKVCGRFEHHVHIRWLLLAAGCVLPA